MGNCIMEAVHIVLEIGEYGYKTDLRNKKTGKGVLIEKREETIWLWFDEWKRSGTVLQWDLASISINEI